uniref:Phosphoglycerate mutase n=1 Tax=Ditylenchus dipsaci TaxID=166011 RepID=A0A915DIZ8_9BILA
MTSILQRINFDHEEGDALIVCHAPSIHAIARFLLDRDDMPERNLTTLEETEEPSSVEGRSKWSLNLEAIPPNTNAHISTASYVPLFQPQPALEQSEARGIQESLLVILY